MGNEQRRKKGRRYRNIRDKGRKEGQSEGQRYERNHFQ
jgi:hypothetical protein